VLDLFSGCGGLSLGFQGAGCEIAGAVEIDADAAKSHGRNFHGGDRAHSIARDITRISPEQLGRDLGLKTVSGGVDIIVGGPPCQAFARVGRPKLREIYAHPNAYRRDSRAQLYLEYLHYVDAMNPLALLMENVPDALNHGGQNIAQEICDVLEARGYVCGYTLLNAAYYGVPQMRERMILVGYRRELGVEVAFPAPTHRASLPRGYESSRAVALKHLNGLFRDASSYIDPPSPPPNCPAAVTAAQAIGDLPAIYARRQLASGTLKRGARHFDEVLAWPTGRPSAWAKQMRAWPGFEADPEGVRDHVIRFLPRDYQIFAQMRAGDQYPEALAVAEKLFEKALRRETKLGRPHRPGSKAYETLRSSIVPPYDASKFPNKWRKLDANEPSRTLMAHLGKDSYSHIHYDSRQARTISVREAARLQSFPDGFKFSGTMNPAFRQIGNAVPPLLGLALAQTMISTIRRAKTGTVSNVDRRRDAA